jgi:hypothetical protein
LLEPADLLRAGAVFSIPAARHRAGVDFGLNIEFEPIIADRRQQSECGLDVAGFENLARLMSVVSPDAGQEVRLELEANGHLILLIFAHVWVASERLLGHLQEHLDMMPDFVGDDIRASEVSLHVVPVLEFLKETEVDKDLFI